MAKYGVPAGRIYRAPEILDDPQFAAREAIVEVETERLSKLKMQNAYPFLSDTPSAIRSPAPAEISQHNAELYGSLLGLDASEIQKLSEDNVI